MMFSVYMLRLPPISPFLKRIKNQKFSSKLTQDIADLLLNQKKVWKIFNDKNKGPSLIWDLDVLLQRAYLEFEMEENSIHRQIIRTYLSKKARENLFWNINLDCRHFGSVRHSRSVVGLV